MAQRVLWVIKGLGPGGAERLLVDQAAVRDRHRFHVECAYVVSAKSHLVADLERVGVGVRCLSTRRRDPWWPVRLVRLVRRGDWDVVHVHSPLPASCARLAVRLLPRSRRALVVSTEHNQWTTFRYPTRVANRWTSRWDRATIAVTGEVAASMSGRAGRRAEVVRHGIDIAGIRATPHDRPGMRRELALDPDTPTIVTVANFRPQKDYPNLLRAARLLVDRGVRFALVSIGQGPDEAEVRALSRSLDLDGVVTFTGFRRDATSVMAACDVFCLASAWEGLPVAMMEATALGLPIVATNVGGIAESMDPDLDALIVPPSDSAALADALGSLLLDPVRRRDLGRASARRARDFDVSESVERIETLYAGAGNAELSRTPEVPTLLDGRRRRIEIRPAIATDRPDVIELCRTALGWGDDARFDRLFGWKHDDNPLGPSFQWVAVDGERLVGLRALMRWEFSWRGDIVRAVRAVDTATHPAYRGQGVFTALTSHALDEVRRSGIDVVFNTPNSASLPGYLKMGWDVVGRLPVAIAPRRARTVPRLFRSRAAAAHWPSDLQPGRPIADETAVDAVTWLDQFAEDAIDRSSALHTRHTPQFLWWRYGESMLGYRTLRCGNGFVIVRGRRRGASQELVILDHLGATEREVDSAVRRALVGAGFDHALRLGGADMGNGFLRVPRIGPVLAARSLGGVPTRAFATSRFRMGDVELF